MGVARHIVKSLQLKRNRRIRQEVLGPPVVHFHVLPPCNIHAFTWRSRYTVFIYGATLEKTYFQLAGKLDGLKIAYTTKLTNWLAPARCFLAVPSVQVAFSGHHPTPFSWIPNPSVPWRLSHHYVEHGVSASWPQPIKTSPSPPYQDLRNHPPGGWISNSCGTKTSEKSLTTKTSSTCGNKKEIVRNNKMVKLETKTWQECIVVGHLTRRNNIYICTQ